MRANLSPCSLISACQPRKDTEIIFKPAASHYQTNQIIKLVNLLKSYLTCKKLFHPVYKIKAKSREIYIILEIFP